MGSAFYFHDSRLDLVPAEHLGCDGIDAEFGRALAARDGWSEKHVLLLERGIDLYWSRYDRLASRCGHLSPPRLRSIGIVRAPSRVRPYCQVLNESTSLLYAADLDPVHSDPELVAYLLAIGERMAETGEILRAAVHLAPWWLERTDEECRRFSEAAHRSDRIDAPFYRAIAAALPWLRDLRHVRLRPPRRVDRGREIPGTGLFVPRRHEAEPDRLIERLRACASAALRGFYDGLRRATVSDVARLGQWLKSEAPSLLVIDGAHRVVWDPADPADTGALCDQLGRCSGEAVASIHADLRCIADHGRRFVASLRDPRALPPPDPTTAQSGYAFLHRERALIAYDLDEPGIERRLGPAIPYARAMLGARTTHEWAHRAVDAGWVPRTVTESEWSRRRDRLGSLLDDVIDSLPRPVRREVGPDVDGLSHGGSAGHALALLFESRLPDFQANLLAVRYQSDAEREAYVRQNVRPLRRAYRGPERLRMLVRYLYELQYLGFSHTIGDRRRYFYDTTWFEFDFFDTGVLTEPLMGALSEAAASLCHAHAVDESRFLPP